MSTTRAYTVDGMTCEHCVRSVTEEITKIEGVTHVAVDLASGPVAVTSDSPVEGATIVAAIDEAGYTVAS